MIIRHTLFILILLGTVPVSIARSPNGSARADSSRVIHELYGVAHGSFGHEIPFWLQHNRYDMVSRQTGILAGGLYRGQYLFRNSWSLDWGSEIHLRSDRPVDGSWLPQAWAGVSWRDLQLSAGRWREHLGLVQQEVSAGASIWSGNSRPMSKIKLELTDYAGLPLTDDWISIRGGISHGWFDGNRHVKDFWLHEKYLYGKLGRPDTPELYAGLIHMVQWGGFDTRRYGQIPSSFRDYMRVVFGLAGGDQSPDQFQFNRFGNSIGSWQAGFIWRLKPVEIWLQKETLFEDTSGFKLRSIEDGVQGVNLLFRHGNGRQTEEPIRTPSNLRHRSGPGLFSRGGTGPQERLTRMTWEFWHTKSQSGPGPADRPPGRDESRDEQGHRYGGQDNYFNHGVYIEGWSYHDRLIGVPLIYYDADRRRVVNNRLIAHHVAVLHQLPFASLHASWTWSRNYGTYEFPFEETVQQRYLMLAWEQSLAPWTGLPLQVRLDLGIDNGELTGDRTGLLFSLGYQFF
ncbi:MAG: capsule assembly Wzi family protein [Balneolaceae bacterium]